MRRTTIAIAFPTTPHSLIAGIVGYARQQGLPWHFYFRHIFNERETLRAVARSCAGLLCLSVGELLSEIRQEFGTPLVALGHHEDPTIATVERDDFLIGVRAAEHFQRRHYHHLGFYHTKGAFFAGERLRGCRSRWPDHTLRIYDGPMGGLERLEKTREWVASLPEKTGIFASQMAYGHDIASMAEELGRPVPETLGLLTGDDAPGISRISKVGISAFQSSDPELGWLMAESLDRQLQGVPGPPVRRKIAPGRILPRGSSEAFHHADPLVARALTFIQQNLTEPITPNDVLAHLHASRRTIERRFRVARGVTLGEEILHARILHARELLEGEALSITEIAMGSGFSSPSKFSARFRAQVGCTPSEYRQRARTADQSAPPKPASSLPQSRAR